MASNVSFSKLCISYMKNSLNWIRYCHSVENYVVSKLFQMAMVLITIETPTKFLVVSSLIYLSAHKAK